MVLEWRLFSYFTVCSFKDLYKKFTAVVFFLTAVKFLYIKRALFFHGRFFLFFTATTAVGRAFFFHFRDVRFTCMLQSFKFFSNVTKKKKIPPCSPPSLTSGRTTQIIHIFPFFFSPVSSLLTALYRQPLHHFFFPVHFTRMT